MSLFDFAKKKEKNEMGTMPVPVPGMGAGSMKPDKKKTNVAPLKPAETAQLAELALQTIKDGILIINKDGIVKYINPAAVEMTGVGKAGDALNLEFLTVLRLETFDGEKVNDESNELLKANRENKTFSTKDYVLVSGSGERKTPVAITLTPSGDPRNDRIVTFRDITKELEEEGAQTEFISTASHEMRTPVASIEGYLGLALNPQTATIDARARQYIESAHSASQRLGHLFKDLLDVTKLDDKRIRAKPVPLELTAFVKKFADEYIPKFNEKSIVYSFGADKKKSGMFGGGKTVEQIVYTYVDVDFLGEILSNLIENAIKYTPEGGAIWVNVQGDGDRALINVTDTGIGIAADDLQHIFQKFYRADNSHTRTVGGTGLGLYLVKQRVEAMNGRVWAESAFGEGSTFYVSLPRLTNAEYEKRQIVIKSQNAVQAFAEQALRQNISENAAQIEHAPNFDPNLLQAQTAELAPVAAPVASATPQPMGSPMQATQLAPAVFPQIQQVQAPVASQPVMPTVQVSPTVQPTTQPMIQSTMLPVVTPMPAMQTPQIQQPVSPTMQSPQVAQASVQSQMPVQGSSLVQSQHTFLEPPPSQTEQNIIQY